MNSAQAKKIKALITLLIILLFLSFYSNVSVLSGATFWNSLWELIRGVLVNIISSATAFLAIFIFIDRPGLLASPTLSRELESRLSSRLNEVENSITSSVDKLGPSIGKEINTQIDLDSNELYRLCGLKGSDSSLTFQDFRISRNPGERNINAVSYLWADSSMKNKVSAEVVQDRDYPFLRISFTSNESSYGCNVCIRPQNEQAKRRDSNLKYLNFKARAISNSGRSEQNDRIGIAVRVINGKFQHWDYGSASREYYHLPVSALDSEWVSISVNLSDLRSWYHFSSDGNQYISEPERNSPDLTVLSGLIIKLGRCGPDGPGMSRGELGPISGTVDLKQIGFIPEML
jgi:hypothetical protein